MHSGCKPAEARRISTKTGPGSDGRSPRKTGKRATDRKPGQQGCSNTRAWRLPAIFPSLGHAYLDDRFRPDEALAANIRTKRFRNHDRSILLLIVFHDCDPGAADSQTGSVQCVHKPDFSAAAGTVADVGSPRLEILEVAARWDFTIVVLAGQPNFDIVALRSSEAHVAGRVDHHARGQLQAL